MTGITSFDLFRGERGVADTYLTSVATTDLFVTGGRYQFIDDLFANPTPSGADLWGNLPGDSDPWPLCYAVTAVVDGVAGPRSASSCTAPPLPAPDNVSASGPPCGGSGEVCVRWDVSPALRITSYVIRRGEQGATPSTVIAERTVGSLFQTGGQYELIDDLFSNPPTAADPYPLCYSVTASDPEGFTSPSVTGCTSP
jgi:hypothetical protein